MTVKKVKILDLMSVFLEQLKLGIHYVDMQIVNEDIIRILPTEPNHKPDTDLNQRIA